MFPSCYFCPLKFTEIHYMPYCKHKDSPYQKWWDVANNKINKDFNNYQLASEYAKEIANLPEK